VAGGGFAPVGRIRFANRYGVLDAYQLDQFEAWLGERLPDSYRQFLVVCNGGVPVPGGFDGGAMDCFFALHDQVWDESTPGGHHARPLATLALEWRDEEPDRCDFPVGQCVDGRWITVATGGEFPGAVWIVDLDSAENSRMIGADFESFVESLK